jgi:glutamyl-tRNA synthetase
LFISSPKELQAEEALQFELDALTHRRTTLDPVKLAFLNKHHLVRTRSTESGLHALVLRARKHIKDAFPNTLVPHLAALTFLLLVFMSCVYYFCSTFTSLEYIEKAIVALQGRLVTLMDLPTTAPYLFVQPAWDDAEARAMLNGISITDYQNVTRGTMTRLRSTTSPWDVQTITDALHAENRTAGIKPARFMTVLRHGMSAVKVRSLGDLCLLVQSKPPETDRSERRRNDGYFGHGKDDRAFGRSKQLVSCVDSWLYKHRRIIF